MWSTIGFPIGPTATLHSTANGGVADVTEQAGSTVVTGVLVSITVYVNRGDSGVCDTDTLTAFSDAPRSVNSTIGLAVAVAGRTLTVPAIADEGRTSSPSPAASSPRTSHLF